MRNQTVAALIFVFCMLLLSSSKWPIWADSELTWVSTKQKIFGHSKKHLEQAKGPDGQKLFQKGWDNNYYSKYPLLQEVHTVPFLVSAFWGNQLGWSSSLIALFMGVWPALLGVLFFWLILGIFQRLGGSLTQSIGMSALLLFTTPLWCYARIPYGEMPQAVFVAWLLYTSLGVTKNPTPQAYLWLGLAWGMSCNSKILFVLWAPFLGFFLLWKHRKEGLVPRFLALVGGALPGMILFLGYNFVRFGNPLTMGYSGGRDGQYGFSTTPMLTGLHGLLLSPGKSIFFYAPCLLLLFWGIRRLYNEQRELCWLHVGPVLLWIVMIANWWAWSGDRAWGPRLIIPLLPLLFVPLFFAVQRLSKLWTAGLAVLGLGIQGLGLCFNPVGFSEVVIQVFQRSCKGYSPGVLTNDLFLSHFVPEFSAIPGHWWLFKIRLFQKAEAPWSSLNIKGWNVPSHLVRPDLDFWYQGSSDALLASLLLCGMLASAWLFVRAVPQHKQQ